MPGSEFFMDVITSDRVRRAVQEFWDAFTHQQKEKFHWEFFHAQNIGTPLEPVAGLVECVIAELELLGRISLRGPWRAVPKSCRRIS